MTRRFNYWVVIDDGKCMRGCQTLMDPRVKLVMGDLCKDCYKSMAYILWYNDDETIEYTVRSFEVITGLSTDILEERKNF